jgi:CRISPR-associated protein Cas1
MYRVETAIEISGLDKTIGFLHDAGYGKNSLVFDLMEQFRTPVVDTLCCSLFNRGVLTLDDFYGSNSEPDSNEGNEKSIMLTREGISKVIAAFEKKVDTMIHCQNGELSYTDIIIEQAAHFKRVLSGEDTIYRGYIQK